MPIRNGVSFRILHPEPSGGSDPLHLLLSAEFHYHPYAQAFHSVLKARRIPNRLSRQGSPFTCLQWSMSLGEIRSFGRSIAGVFPDLGGQMEEGLKGFLRQGNKGFAGRHSPKPGCTLIMGILNVTPDSFSDGGKYLDPHRAVARAVRLKEEGADWIDIGGESTRPGAKAVSAKEEKRRILPVLKACVRSLKVPLSVDTYKAEVARAAVGEGARMVNDIGALGLDPRMASTLAQLKVPVILMHMQGKPRTMQKKPAYRDVVGDILFFFRERMAYAQRMGISQERLLLDPGFGFGKTPRHNIELTRRLWEFKVLNRPLVMGPSRKSTLGFLLGGAPPEERVEATGAAVAASILKGADMVRVHDVKAMAAVVKVADAIRYGRGLAKP